MSAWRNSVVAAVVAVLLASCSGKATTESSPNGTEVAEEVLQRHTTTEVLVDMGTVARSATTHYDITLRNTTDTTLLLLDYEATCRCVWLELPRRALAPNESATLRLWFDSRGEWGTVGNYIGVTSSLDDVALAVWMMAEVE